MKQEAERLKSFRDLLKMTQTELAEALGIKQDLVSRYESGSYSIPLDIVKKMYLKFKMNYVWLFHGYSKPRVDQIERASITTDVKEVLLENKILKEKIKYLDKQLENLDSRLQFIELSKV